jgi:transposase
LRARGIDAHVIHAISVAISREHRRAKTDRIDTAMLRRGFFGWLRGEPGHCTMAIVPTVAEEDTKRPHRERESLVNLRTSTVNRMKSTLIRCAQLQPGLAQSARKARRRANPRGDASAIQRGRSASPSDGAISRHQEQIKAIERTRLERLQRDPAEKFSAMVVLLVQIIGLGVETAEQLVHEILDLRGFVWVIFGRFRLAGACK